jgi:ribonuclease-3
LTRTASLEDRLGYRFRRAALLQQALTHRSFGVPHNERLEFLGDGVLGCVIAEQLHDRFTDLAEGDLTRLRARLVREEALAGLARRLGLPEALRLGDAELSAGRDRRPSILADALEAVFGAVFRSRSKGGGQGREDTPAGTDAGRAPPFAGIPTSGGSRRRTRADV